jgi:tetratricopeptide (TPR) repeat protein
MSTENESAMANRRHACPEAEQLAGYADGVVSASERHRIEQHAADCDDCRMVLAESAAYMTQVGSVDADERPRYSRNGKRLIAVAAALAAAAAVVIVSRIGVFIPFGGSGDRGFHSSQLPVLATAVAKEPTRLVEGRLPTFSYGPPPSLTRGMTTQKPSADVRMAAAAIEKDAFSNNSIGRSVDLGIALLTVGELDRAVGTLENATRGTTDSDAFNDLAVAYLTRAMRTGRTEDLSAAAAAVEQALRLQPRNESALFNKAVILNASNRPAEAQAAADEYLKLDAASSWAAELRTRLHR